MHPSVHCNTIDNSQDMEATQMFTNIGMDKEMVVHIYNVVFFSGIKKEWNNAICSKMNWPRDYLSKLNKSDKDKHHIILLIYEI